MGWEQNHGRGQKPQDQPASIIWAPYSSSNLKGADRHGFLLLQKWILWTLTFHCVTWKPHKKLNREVLPGKHHFPNLLIALLLTGRSLQSLNGEHETHAVELFTETTWWHIQSYQLSTLELSAINFHWCRDYYNFQVSQRLYLKVLILFATHLMLRHISVQGWNSIQRNSKDLAGANQWIVTVCNVLLLHWWEFHPILAFFCAYMLN